MLFGLVLADHTAAVELRLSHQWPDDTGDMRHEMARIIQEELHRKKLGVEVKIFPHIEKGELKIKPWQQWSALTSGIIDMSIYPLAYAGPKHPEFNLTLMPGIIRNHEHALRLNNSRVMQEIKKIMREAGVVVIADAWLAGGMVSSKRCVAEPKDAKDLWLRSAGITYNQMLAEAGAKIASMPSSKIKEAMHNDELDGAITSSSSLVSYKIYEESKCLIAPGKVSMWFMYEPVIMARAKFDELNEAQQAALLAAGKLAEQYGFTEAKKADAALIATFRQHGVEVRELTEDQFLQWREVAEDSSYKEFTAEVRNGEQLLKWALQELPD